MKYIKYTLLTIICLCSLTFIYSDEPPYLIYTFGENDRDVPKLNFDLLDVYNIKQNRNWTIFTTTPTANDIKEGEVVQYHSGDTHRFYTLYNGDLLWWTTGAHAAGGGVTDHGALTGLGDDDHPLYVEYSSTVCAQVDTNVSDIATNTTNISGNDTDITNLQNQDTGFRTELNDIHTATGTYLTKSSATATYLQSDNDTGLVFSTGATMTGVLTTPEIKVDTITCKGGSGLGGVVLSTNIVLSKNINIGPAHQQGVQDHENDLTLLHFDVDQQEQVNDAGSESWYTFGDAAATGIGKYGNAMTFDGNGDYVMLYDSHTNNEYDLFDEMTVCAWVKADNFTGHGWIAAKSDEGLNRSWELGVLSSHKIFFNKGDGGSNNGADNITGRIYIDVNEWYHITATWDGSDSKVYVNGTLDTTDPCTTSMTDTAMNIYIGQIGDNGYWWDGLIDEFRFSTYAFTADQIWAEYSGGKYYLDAASIYDLHVRNLYVHNLADIYSESSIRFFIDSNNDEAGGVVVYNDGRETAAHIGFLTDVGLLSLPGGLTLTGGECDFNGANVTECGYISFGTGQDTIMSRPAANRLIMSASDSFGCGTVSSLPTSGHSEGDMLYNTTDHTLYVATKTVTTADSWKPVW